MDDNSFDNIIKGKVGEYEDPVFDASSLSAFHHRMATLGYMPWYSRYRTELTIGSGIVISTLLIIWSIWLFNSQASKALEKNNVFIEAQQEQISKLQDEINYLKSLPADTVHIIQFREQSAGINKFVLHRITELESTILKMKKDFEVNSMSAENFSTGADSLSANSMANTVFDPLYTHSFTSRLVLAEKQRKSVRAIPKPMSMPEQTLKPFSAKTVRSLEKHYHNGIGIRLGPVLEFSKGFYGQGTGGIDITGGLLGDFIVSPSFSLETGAKFIHRFYVISGDQVKTIHSKLPYVNADLAPVTVADIDSWMMEFPLNLKYRYPLSTTTHGLASLGYSSLIYTKQILEYSYDLDGVPSGHITEPHTISAITRYAGSLNISLGLSKRLKNKEIIETSLYYQHGLGTAGVEKMRSNFLGIRGAYWFSIK